MFVKNLHLKSFLILFATLLFYSSAWCQTKISGKVSNGRKQPLAGVSITIKDTYDGATSDSLGNFELTTSETGEHLLEASITGHTSYSKNISLDGQPQTLDIILKENITELKAVVLTAGSFEAGDKKKATVLTALDIVTTASAEGDVTGAIKTLPGAQQVGESTGLFVRGGTATETKIYIDGSLVNNFFYSTVPGIASRGRFNPFLFKGTIFSAGGYSALYGQALSSALILESQDLPERSQGDFSASVIGVGGGLQKLSKDKKSSWGATYYYANLALAFAVIKQRQDYFTSPSNHTADFNFRRKTGAGFIKYYGYFSRDNVGFRYKDIDSAALKDAFRLNNVNTYHNFSWKGKLVKGWHAQAALSYSNNRDKASNELQDENDNKVIIMDPEGYAFKNFRLKSLGNYAQARLVLEKKGRGLNSFRLGSDHFYSKERSHYTMYEGSQFTETFKDDLTAIFAEKDFYISNSMAARIGTRFEYSTFMKEWNAAPRLSLAYKLKNSSQLSFAYGIFYQSPESKYLPVPGKLDYAKASHYILQFQRLTGKRTFRTELFHKEYEDLFKTGSGNGGRIQALNNNGYGYARGVEIFWRDKATIKNFDYWISYSFLDTKRDYLNFPVQMEPSFAAKHTASLVMKKFVMKWKIGFNASYNYTTGRPYYNLVYSPANDKYEIKDLGRTTAYNNLSFGLNYLPKLGKPGSKKFAVWVLSVSNVLGSRQVYGYNYATLSDRKEAILPPSRRFVYIGYFLSIGTDRTEDAINNNL